MGTNVDATVPAVPRRMRGDARRRQLLDVAAEIIVAEGVGAISMERLAAGATVSKALPYKHFENSGAVLAALYRRETTELGQRVWRALRDAPADSDMVRIGVSAYFDEIVARGPILDALSRPGSTIAAVADPDQAGVIFEVEVLSRFHGLPRERSKAIAGMVQGAVVGAAATMRRGYGTRRALEDDLVAVIGALVASDAAPPPG